MNYRSLGALALLLPLNVATAARAEEPPPVTGSPAPVVEPPTTPSPTTPGSLIFETTKSWAQRPGRFHLGPLYLTPHLRLGSIGLDTNVFYTPTDRKTDVRGSVGPGLDIVIPMGQTFRLTAQGGLDYLYFVRTPSERHLIGFGTGGVEWQGARTDGGLLGRYADTFDRLSTEVDRRIRQAQHAVQLRLHRRLAGRTGLNLEGSISRQTTPEQIVLGTDLSKTLTSDTYMGKTGLDYALTSKTFLLLQGGAEKTRFPLDPSRDGLRPQLTIGLRSEAQTLLSGSAAVGGQWYRSSLVNQKVRGGFYADVDVSLHLSLRTALGLSYLKGIEYTAFTPIEGTPTVRRETIGASLHKGLIANFDLTLQARRSHSRTDNAVRLVLPTGETIAIRDDVSYEYTGELGFRVASRLWMGGTFGYGQRQSNVSDLGIEGLLLGGKINFTP